MFGEVAELYDKARPSYPAALVDLLVGLIGPRGQVLDVGCGTAKAATLLAQRRLGGVGVEPDPEMAAMARHNLAPFPNWSVSTVDFEAYEPEGGETYDLLTCAQAWHWLDPTRRLQLAARRLRPGGWLALFWNRTAEDPSELRQAVDRVYDGQFSALSPHGLLTAGHPPVGPLPADSGFASPERRVFSWVQRYTTSEWTDLVQTHSDHRVLDEARRQALIGQLTEVIDAYGGVYDHPYECWLWVAQRVGGA